LLGVKYRRYIPVNLMSTSNVYLALGTNLGNRSRNLQAAIAALPPDVMVLERSPVYVTQPWGVTEQPAFLNMVIKGRTTRSPLELLDYLKRLEAQLGRLPSVRYGPRKIDIDILFYDDVIINTPALTIPHPGLQGRAFVLVPLADLAPELLHPVLGKTVRQLLAEVDTSGVKQYG
jgi:2-amino-4-hydroxy-6-hydroxymethyldihydropteridine diphosphokinase